MITDRESMVMQESLGSQALFTNGTVPAGGATSLEGSFDVSGEAGGKAGAGGILHVG